LFKNIAFKQISALWQAILGTFGFNKEYIKSSDNLIPDFPYS
jgi:hypothetical protein